METTSSKIVVGIAITGACLLTLPAGALLAQSTGAAPGSVYDLSHWKITLPLDEDNSGSADEVEVSEMGTFANPEFFYLDADGRMVFTAPNKATTTANSSNTRSELRYMLRGDNTRIRTQAAGNNFAVEARRDSDKFGAIGGKMEATLRVDHVAVNAGNPNTKAAYSAVVGQIHALSYENNRGGFGYGNEPIKIFYKKWPGHETGSVFWTYERNLAKDDPNRTDIAVPVWGNLWDNAADPGEAGIALGEEFSYTINVYRNTMFVTFTSPGHETVAQNVSLVAGVDELDNPYSYGGDSLYFKAGVYNQCSTNTGGGLWYAGCGGTGDWTVDKANGDYAQVSFSKLVVGPSTPE